MTQKAEERDSILRVRAKVDSYDELEESRFESAAATNEAGTNDNRIVFCAAQKWVRVGKIAAGLAKQEFSVNDFARKLSHFLRDFADTKVTVQGSMDWVVCSNLIC